MNQADFQQLAAAGYNRIPLVREVLADTETPLSTYLKLGSGLHSYLFESIQGGEKWGRYSIIGLPCNTILRVIGDRVTVEAGGKVVEESSGADPFAFIAEFQSRYRVAEIPDRQLFAGGLVGYFAYDSVRYVETSMGPAPGEDQIGTPDILLMLSEEVVVFDNLRGTISFIINVDPSAKQAYENAELRLNQLQAELHKPVPLPKISTGRNSITESDFAFHFQQQQYQQAVGKIKDYIVAGDVMQVVLAQRMSVDFSGDPVNIYRALRFLNPSPYMVYFDLGDHHVVSASPEILARVDAGKITVRPLAGTRKRGATEAEDLALEKELLADSKELAEHLMLIDLSRNDSGRVSKIGSVTVPKKMFIERYSHVMHIASIVESEIREDKTSLQVLQATLPVGTLSGAPKVRAMQVIDELEPEKRGIYGGAMGYLAWNGNMDMAIAIRTAVIKNHRLFIQAGAGIVADSQPQMEWEETLNKARAIARAVQMANESLRVD
ncbi:MAG TPA: anthranilate synthase component I [Gammaproteobacteria bacterium]|jgi:anthranilate synthase component 1|nr:anthranilate synthase component I [Gammaproteobacteria bacterium]HAT26928.1 anthranilate synthase component I [Gammaproteobacteria bacterium]|tara:strand:- start:570 stop:2051 length:1482 start_codon:yes stop_codon:yes gene_type:complete